MTDLHTRIDSPAVDLDHATFDTRDGIVETTAPSDPGPAISSSAPQVEPPDGVTLPDPDNTADADTNPERNPLSLSGFAELRIFAETFEDTQKSRVALTNRLKRAGIVDDALTAAVDAHQLAERKLALAMKRRFRVAAPAVHAWTTNTVGLGEHSMARLLGVIGHPLIATPHHWEGDGADRVLVADPPYMRTVSQLWSYCGHGDPNRKRRKGMTAADGAALGNPRAKMLAHLIAESAMKCVESDKRAGSPYRVVYDDARVVYAERDGWSDGRRHNAAVRKVAKEILRDLWIVAHDDLRADD